MVRKFFPFDKNYVLEEAQLASKDHLLQELFQQVKDHYLSHHNPLALEDETTLAIQACKDPQLNRLEGLYAQLAGIYRYKFGENQLEFLFDGQSHYQKYMEEWVSTFRSWVMEFCLHSHFLKTVLEFTVFHTENTKLSLIDSRMKHFISTQFELKVYKYRGIVEMKHTG